MNFLHCQQFFADFRQLSDTLVRARATQARCLEEAFAQYAADFARLSHSCAQAKSAHAKKLRQNLEAYCAAFSHAYREWRKQERDFNLWQFAFRKPREMECTYLLSRFLDARAAHGQGSAFFAGFLELIDDEYWAQGKKPQVPAYYSVKTEVAAKNGKSRMDLIIKGHDFLLIVEAKVYSAEHGQQLKRYHTLAKKSGAENFALVFLTIKGEGKGDHMNAKRLSWKEVGEKFRKVLYGLDTLPKDAPAHLACRDFCNYINRL